MAEPWLVSAKLLAPAAAPDLLARALPGPAPVTVLGAGPGYGKTALLRTLLDQAGPDALTLWYGLDADDEDPAVAFAHLLTGMERHVPGFGEPLRPLLAAGAAPRLWWRRFFEQVAGYNLPGLVLALDDVHHLPAEALAGLVHQFDKLPPRTRLLLASRRKLPAGLAALRARGTVRLLEPAQLRFTPEETQAFLAARAPQGGVPAAWLARARALDGWPLGLALLVQRPDAGWRDGDDDALAAYVAEELVAAHPPDRQAFMRRAALLDELDAEACRAVAGPDAAEHLAALAARHLVQPLDATGAYRFPAYLRAWLLAAAPAEPQAHRDAAAYLAGRGQRERAIPHWIAGGAWEEAVAACAAEIPRLDAQGRQGLVRRWLAAFPPEQVAAEPLLLFWRGRMQAKAGQLEAAAADLEAARRAYAEREDAAGQLKALVRLLTLALYGGDRPRFLQLLLRAQALLPDGHPEDVADWHLARALGAEQAGDLALMEECNRAVLALPVGQNAELAACHAVAAMNLYTLAWHRGELAAAHRHVAQALEVAGAWRFHVQALVAGFLQAHLWLSEGELARAEGFLRELPPYWDDLLDWHGRGLAATVLGAYHQATGAWKEAEDSLRRALTSFERAGYAEGRLVPLERLAWLALARRQYQRLEALTAQAAADGASVQALALVVPRARGRHLQGEPARAVAELEAAIPALEGLSAHLHVARARLVEAAARLGAGQPAEAARAHAAAMRLVDVHGYGFLLTQDAQLRAELQALDAPAPTARAGLAVRCLGGFEVRVDGAHVDRWPRRKAQAILLALLLHPDGLALADLAFVLGIETYTPAVARTLLADISALRKTLEPGLARGEHSRFVQLAGERYRVPPEALVAFDWHDLAAALAGPEPAAVPARYPGALVEDGPFAGLFEAEREGARQGVSRALLRLAEGQDDDTAEGTLRRAIALAPCDEALYLALIRRQHAAGRPDRLRQVYWDCRKALQRQLGLLPSEAFEAAFREIGAARPG